MKITREAVERKIHEAEDDKSRTWWVNCLAAYDFFIENGNFNFLKDSTLATWASGIRTRWESLDGDKLGVLRKMGFPRYAEKGATRKMGTSVERLVELAKKVAAQIASPDERREYDRGMLEMHKKYRSGQLGRTAVAALGIQ